MTTIRTITIAALLATGLAACNDEGGEAEAVDPTADDAVIVETPDEEAPATE